MGQPLKNKTESYEKMYAFKFEMHAEKTFFSSLTTRERGIPSIKDGYIGERVGYYTM